MTRSSIIYLPLSPALPPPQINQATHDQALVLQSALQNIPNPASECMLRNVAIRLAQQISDEVTENVRNWSFNYFLFRFYIFLIFSPLGFVRFTLENLTLNVVCVVHGN